MIQRKWKKQKHNNKQTTTSKNGNEISASTLSYDEQKLDEHFYACWKRVSMRFYSSKWTTSSLLVVSSQLLWPQPFPMCATMLFFHLLFCEFQRRKKKQRIKSYGVYFTYMAKIAYALWLIPNMLLAIVVSLLCSRSPIEIQMLNAYHSLLAARTCQIWFGIIVVNCN